MSITETVFGQLPAVLLRAQGIAKVYGGIVALDEVDFDVERGRVSVLIGENGAGKTTLMRILSGVEPPTRGRLLLDGRPVRFASPRAAAAAGVAIIHQELSLFPHLSVAENVFAGREPRRTGGGRERDFSAGICWATWSGAAPR